MKRLISIILFSLLFLFVIFSCRRAEISSFKIVPTDTITLHVVSKAYRLSSYYDNIDKITYISYLDKEKNTINLLIIDSNRNERFIAFPLKNALDSAGIHRKSYMFYFIDSNTVCLMVKKSIEGVLKPFFMCINSNGNKWRLLDINSVTHFAFQTPLYPFSFSKNKVFIATIFPQVALGERQLNDYQFNNSSRLKVFSKPPTVLFYIGDTMANIISQFAAYPIVLLDTSRIFYNYFPEFIPISDTSVLFVYEELDTLYESSINCSGLTKTPIRSSFKNVNNKEFDMDELYNYDYIQKWACETSGPLYIKYNSRSKFTFVIYKIAVNYINDDGTVNKAVNNPFSLIVFDSLKNQILEQKISKEFSKHNSFTVNNGIALLSNSLTQNNPNNFATYVVFELENDENNK